MDRPSSSPSAACGLSITALSPSRTSPPAFIRARGRPRRRPRLAALEDVPVPGAEVRLHLPGHLFHLVPRRGRFGETGPLQVPAAKEHPGVGEPRYAPGLTLVLDSLQGAVEVAFFHAVGEAIREVEDVAIGGELRRSGDVARDHVHVGLAGLQFGPHLLEVLGAGGGHLAPHDPYPPGCSSLKRRTNSHSPSAPLLLKAKTSLSPPPPSPSPPQPAPLEGTPPPAPRRPTLGTSGGSCRARRMPPTSPCYP